MVTESLELRGAPAWAPDGLSITSAANVDGTPHLFRISLDGARGSPGSGIRCRSRVVSRRRFPRVLGRGRRHHVPGESRHRRRQPYAIPNLTLTRGARRLRFLRGRRALVVMRGEIQHKDLWLDRSGDGNGAPVDQPAARLQHSGLRRVSRWARIVLERVQEQSDVVLIDRGAGRLMGGGRGLRWTRLMIS